MTKKPKYKHNEKHPGFSAIAKRIAKRQKVPLSDARAELASSSRRASAAARKHNPRINRIRGT